ncbi:hypothetical protein ACHFCA_17350 [Delftia tsuruhatensis]
MVDYTPKYAQKEGVLEGKTNRVIVWDAIRELHQQGQVVTREALSGITGVKLINLDDHIKRFVESGNLRRIRPGVFIPVDDAPEPRAVTVTKLSDGRSIVEIGEHVVHLWPRERRDLATLLVGDAVQLSNIQTGNEVNFLVNTVWEELKLLKGAFCRRRKCQKRLNSVCM